MNHGRGANSDQTINHCLSVNNGVGWNALKYALVCRFDLAGSKVTRRERQTKLPNVNCESLCLSRKTDRIWFDTSGSPEAHIEPNTSSTHVNRSAYKCILTFRTGCYESLEWLDLDYSGFLPLALYQLYTSVFLWLRS
ncbi:hypothetical protein AVEN_235160-1 [Araneus ventricosus]|uniref:Uncharacterized protein n=1 Tax=Araneus ventricosus TaxID=182803 RepID=A0A4Y2H839_ARAVE|nr:hypothetical protein AVEN_235160-1 [Araneus ventricosus]